ncbi:hypothetical protein R1A27_31010 (plasmid) [Methylobacterium sp. NMS12]|uniref:hypothetical protein n=1 Tax=Methylobacterium sp. NMS12 TaxID=3079766 RepID=UPI003F8813D7
MGEADEVPRISAAMFAVGYGFAVVTAVLAGCLWDASGMAVLAVLPFAFTAALTGLLGLTLRQPVAALPHSP